MVIEQREKYHSSRNIYSCMRNKMANCKRDTIEGRYCIRKMLPENNA